MISFISSLSSLDLNQLAFANDLTGPATAFLEMDGLMDSALVIGQAAKWLPTWLTPLWVIAVGLVLGALVCAAVFGVLAALSFIPALGRLADSPKRGVSVSLVVGGVIAGLLWSLFVPRG